MDKEHVLSDVILNDAKTEIARGNEWVAYNSINYFMEKGDVYFFPSKEEADIFSDDNISEYDMYDVIHADSVQSLFNQIVYGEAPEYHLSSQELGELFQSFDWDISFYDPLHDTIEATTDNEKEGLVRMELLLNEWERLYERDPETALKLAAENWEGRPMEVYKNDFLTVQFDLMNEKNLDYLKTNVRNHGFGDTLHGALEAQLKQGNSEFTLAFQTEVNKKSMEATLYFKKSNESDLYFFNKYDTRLNNEKNETVAQTFYINKGWGVTLKEAYNLLNGRAVHKEFSDKEGQKYQAWIQLDFKNKDKNGNFERKQYHENYGYDLKEALSYYPVKEMLRDEDAKNLLRSLERGNLQQVTINAGGNEVKVFLEANPQYKTVTLYSDQLQRLDQEQRNGLMQEPASNTSVSTSQTESKQQEKTEGESKDQKSKKELNDGDTKQRSKKNPSAKKSADGLVEKKRTNGKKGLGIG